MKRIAELPSFFKDESNSDKVEEVIDYFLSWTLRCSIDTYKDVNEQLNKYSKEILSYLLFNDFNKLSDKKISNLTVEKQFLNVDLWIEAYIEDLKYALIIENKMYSNIRSNQLQKYREIAKNFYSNQKNVNIKFVFIRPDYELSKEKEYCQLEGFRYVIIEDIQDHFSNKPRTTNDIFNEIWFNWK